MLPREHGSWALLAVPPLIGLAAAGALLTFPAFLFLLGSLGVFLFRVPLLAVVSRSKNPDPRPWLLGYAALAAVGFAPLLFVYGRWGLLAFALPAGAALMSNIHLTTSRRALSLGNELTGIVTLALGAPAAAYAATGALGAEGWWLWVLNALFFCGPVFHVKGAALRHRAAQDPSLAGACDRMSALSISYHAAAAALGLALAATGSIPVLAAVPLLAALGKAWRGALFPAGRVDFRRLGYNEVGFAVLFLALSSAAYLV